MTFIQRRFKQFSRFQREGIGSLQLRLTLGITAVSLLGLGSIGTWTIWDMRQMLLVKHKQSLELVADRFPEGLERPTSKSAMTQTLQHKVGQWASPSLWIWVKVEGEVVAQSPPIAPMEPLFSRLTMPTLPAVYVLRD